MNQQALQNFEKLWDLVSTFDQVVHQAYIHQSFEIFALTIATSTHSSQSFHLMSIDPIPFVISTTHSLVSLTITQPIPTNPISTPPLRPHIVPPNMVARYAPLVLPTLLHDIPYDYQTRIPQFDSTSAINAQHHR